MTDSRTIVWLNALRSCGFFSDLPKSELAEVLTVTSAKSVERGHFLFEEGDPVSGFYLVRTGAISLQRKTSSGKEVVFHVFRPGETFAESTLVSEQYPADALALESTELLHFSKSGFLKLLETQKGLPLQTIKSMSQQMQRLVNRIEKNREIDAPGRVATWLMERCATPNGDEPCTIELKIQKAALADELHMRSETLSRSLKKLRTEGLISVSGSNVTINNPKKMMWYINQHNAEE